LGKNKERYSLTMLLWNRRGEKEFMLWRPNRKPRNEIIVLVSSNTIESLVIQVSGKA